MISSPSGQAVLLQEAPLRELIAAKVVKEFTAKGRPGGFVLEIQFGERTAVLASARGGERMFASLSTLATLMKRIGSPKFNVDAADFSPGRVRAAQPERSAAMKGGSLPKAAAKSKPQPRAVDQATKKP